MKKFRILMGALALAMVAATVIACSKEKETNVVQQATETEDVVRKPIATFDKETGQMTYHVSIDQLQNSIDNFTLIKGEDEYVVESWQILEDDPSGLPYLKFVLLDIQDESSLSIYLFDHFVEKYEEEAGTEFLLNEDVVSGNYYYYISPQDEVYYIVTVENGTGITIKPWEGRGTKTMPGGTGTSLTCRAQGCKDSETECRVQYGEYGTKKCSPCASPGQCDWTECAAVTVVLLNAM